MRPAASSGGGGRSGTRGRRPGVRWSVGGALARPSRSTGVGACGGGGAPWRRRGAGVAPRPRRPGARARGSRSRRRGRSGSSGGTAAAAPPAAPTAPCTPRTGTTTPSSPKSSPPPSPATPLAQTWARTGSCLLAGWLALLCSWSLGSSKKLEERRS
uniref:Uncharacterized protein n=1 Tax=Triticum urartu TaxID=4572 RepID=A0A8R7UC24_TRIUA